MYVMYVTYMVLIMNDTNTISPIEMDSKYTTLSYLREYQDKLDFIIDTENIKRRKEGKERITSRAAVIYFLVDDYMSKEGIQ